MFVVFSAKILIEHICKNHLGKHPTTQNNVLMVFCAMNIEGASSEKETVCVRICDKTEICHVVSKTYSKIDPLFHDKNYKAMLNESFCISVAY